VVEMIYFAIIVWLTLNNKTKTFTKTFFEEKKEIAKYNEYNETKPNTVFLIALKLLPFS
jgi:hypothetical protein